MAIRIEHQPAGAAVAAAAYTTGYGRGRERRLKYTMDLLQNERQLQARRQDQLTGFRYQAALQQAGQGFQAQQNAQNRVFALQRDADRAGRAGLDRAADAARLQQEELRGVMESALPQVPAHLEGTPAGVQLRKNLAGQNELLFGSIWDLNQPETQKGLADLQDQWSRIVEANPAPSKAEMANQDIMYFDEGANEFFDAPAPGRIAYRASTGEPLVDKSAEQKTQAAEEKKQQDEKNKRDDAIVKQAEANYQKVENGRRKYPTQEAALQAAIETQERLEKFRANLNGTSLDTQQESQPVASQSIATPASGPPVVPIGDKISFEVLQSSPFLPREVIDNVESGKAFPQNGAIYKKIVLNEEGSKWVEVFVRWDDKEKMFVILRPNDMEWQR